MSETAITISLLALVAVIGLWIGHFRRCLFLSKKKCDGDNIF